MKGLIQTVIIILVLLLVSIGVSAFIAINLNHELAEARELGIKEGYKQGYKEGFERGNKAGYQEGSKTGYVQAKGEENSDDGDSSHFVYNPTYSEVQEILAMGEMNSAEEVLEYADDNGIRAAYVRIQLASQAEFSIPQLVAFETVDRGLVIIEPWSYRKVKVEVDKSYSELNGMPSQPYDDTITKIQIIW